MYTINPIIDQFVVIWYDRIVGEGVVEDRNGKKYVFHQAEYTRDYRNHHDLDIETGEILAAKPYDNGVNRPTIMGIVRSRINNVILNKNNIVGGW